MHSYLNSIRIRLFQLNPTKNGILFDISNPITVFNNFNMPICKHTGYVFKQYMQRIAVFREKNSVHLPKKNV